MPQPAENGAGERLAAIEAGNASAGTRMLGEEVGDGVWTNFWLAAPPADDDALGVAARAIENRESDSFVVNDHVGVLQRLQRTQSKKIRLSRTGVKACATPT